jgi:hypothetical protein
MYDNTQTTALDAVSLATLRGLEERRLLGTIKRLLVHHLLLNGLQLYSAVIVAAIKPYPGSAVNVIRHITKVD